MSMILISSLFLSLQYFFGTSLAKPYCTPSACGIIPNISYPFRLKDAPNSCGNRRLELVCENNVTSIYLNSHKYYVKDINYHNETIRVVDASINNDDTCSFPNSSLCHYHFHLNNDFHLRPLSPSIYTQPIHFMSCPTQLKNSSLFTDITYHCASISSLARFTYIKVGLLYASDVPETCGVEMIVMTSWIFNDSKNIVSLTEIHHSLLYGFELYLLKEYKASKWEKFAEFYLEKLRRPLLILLVIVVVSSAWIFPPVTTIIGITVVLGLIFYWYVYVQYQYWYVNWYDEGRTAAIISFLICTPRVIICAFAMWILIYKFRRRHLSMFVGIESYLQSDNKLMPIRYAYSDIKNMTKGFQDKLGEGGYGSVYKGKLRSGHDVAVKLLGKFEANGQDFINEIATIGMVHHVNIVKLVGYCVEGSKRALVLDFMPNGSLEKYLFNQEKTNSLNWDTKFEIAIGIARGIEYLHRGCDVQILHFDIKPHNILLDDKFIPKVSDFGLAKFCSADKNAVTMTTARGTIGYIAPELITRSIGVVSYKADVFSFGMLLMEMVGLNRHSIGNDGDSNLCFPYWIYDYFHQGNDIGIRKGDIFNGKDENDSTRKLIQKMTIVALWCIQMSPDDRPSMNKVLEMLEGNVEHLCIPEPPSYSTQIMLNEDQIESTYSTDNVPFINHENNISSCVEITIQE